MLLQDGTYGALGTARDEIGTELELRLPPKTAAISRLRCNEGENSHEEFADILFVQE